MIQINNVHDEKIEHEEEAKKYTFNGYQGFENYSLPKEEKYFV